MISHSPHIFVSLSSSIELEDKSAQHRLKYDEERKYGKIPARIYLLYLKACGIPTLAIFFTSTFMWQALRIYTDVWLRDWTDDDDSADVGCKGFGTKNCDFE